MEWYIIIKKIDFLENYKVGDKIPLYRDNKGQLIHHIWRMIKDIPYDCVELLHK